MMKASPLLLHLPRWTNSAPQPSYTPTLPRTHAHARMQASIQDLLGRRRRRRRRAVERTAVGYSLTPNPLRRGQTQTRTLDARFLRASCLSRHRCCRLLSWLSGRCVACVCERSSFLPCLMGMRIPKKHKC